MIGCDVFDRSGVHRRHVRTGTEEVRAETSEGAGVWAQRHAGPHHRRDPAVRDLPLPYVPGEQGVGSR